MLLLDRTTSRFSPVSRSIRSILSVRASHQYSFPSYRPEAPTSPPMPSAPHQPQGPGPEGVSRSLLPPVSFSFFLHILPIL